MDDRSSKASSRPPDRIGRIVAVAGIALGLIGLGIDFAEMVPFAMQPPAEHPAPRSIIEALVWYLTYFTHLTNIGLVLVYVAALTGWPWLGWFTRERTRALLGGYILLVMVYYHVMLAGIYPLEGPMLVATYLLHYVTPLLYLGWWTFLSSHGGLRGRDIPWMLVPGLAYVALVLIRGAISGEYPYEILDATRHGYGTVAVGVSVLVAAVACFCGLLVAADRLLGRKPTTAA